MKKAGFSLILAVFLTAGLFANSAAAWIPEPTAEQKEIFSKSIVPWIKQTWEEKTQMSPDVYALQEITEIKLVRVDDYEENPAQKVYLVNVFFHAKFFTDGQLDAENDMLIKAYFLMEDSEIKGIRGDIVVLESTPPKQETP